MALTSALALAAEVEQLEDRFDQLLGGLETRPWRELLAYCASRLTAAGADMADILKYLSQLAVLAAASQSERPS